MDILVLLIVCGISAALAVMISREEDRLAAGLLGFVLGPVGVIAAAIAFRKR